LSDIIYIMPGYLTPAQQSTNPFTPTGNISATTVGDAIVELDTEKSPKASPVFTGTVAATNIKHPNSSNINMVLAEDGSVSGGIPAGGRNRIINGGFDVWQRGTSFSSAGYSADRWAMVGASGQTVSVSQQTFTAGAAPVVGYEGTNFLRAAWSGTPSGTYWLTQRVEDVRTFANQTVTLSFWAKASSNTSLMTPIIEQNFGSGGSSVVTTTGTNIALTTVWQRFSQTFNIPSISGKTIGGSSYLDVRPFVGSSSVNGINFDLWGVQLEKGAAATPFEVESPGDILIKCQRYFIVLGRGENRMLCQAAGFGTTDAYGTYVLPVTMRTQPTLVQTTGTNYYAFNRAGGSVQFNSFASSLTDTWEQSLRLDAGTLTGSHTAGVCGWFKTFHANAFVAVSAEL
jgi:hypothetical protein